MADEDEFEFDDIDEDTLAAIAEIESKAIAATQVKTEPGVPPASVQNNSLAFRSVAASSYTTSPRQGPPPPKRPRTEGWKPQQQTPKPAGGVNRPAQTTTTTATSKAVQQPSKPASTRAKSTFDDFDFAPDISISVDGTYTVTSSGSVKPPKTTTSHAPGRPPEPIPASTVNVKANDQNSKPAVGSTFQRPALRANSPATFTGPPPPSTNNPPNRPNLAPPQQFANRQRSASPAPGPLASQTNNFQSNANRAKSTGSGFKPALQRASNSYQGPISQSVNSNAGDVPPRSPFPAPGSQDVKRKSLGEHSLPPSAGPLDNEGDFEEKLEQLRLETETLKVSLQKAREEKMMKEGEASNMKRALEKQNQQHAADIARLKAERDAKVSAEIEAQNVLKAQMEALKARLNFQSIERESASGKWSTRQTNQYLAAGSQVGQTPSRRVNALAFTADAWAATPSRRTSATPARSQRSGGKGSSPLKGLFSSTTKVKATKKEEKRPVQEDTGFASFHNSFAKGGSPVKKRGDKSKFKDTIMESPTKSSPTKAMAIDDDDGSPRKSQRSTQALSTTDTEAEQEYLDQVETEQFQELLASEPTTEPWRTDWKDE
ncbi:hypothetical protein FRB90_008881, partial [Tulasnella sp. 427]